MGLRRVWIEDGCILCNVCVEISPEAFVLEDEHCWVRTDADLDELFLDAADTVILAALEAIGDDPQARFQFFRRLLAVAQVVSSGLAAEGRARDCRQRGGH